MPTLVLQTPSPLTSAQATQLAQTLTQITAQWLHKRAEVTAVLIDAAPRFWAIGGAQAARPTARLEITITQGSNSAAEKSAFVAAAHAALQDALAGDTEDGLLALASYVSVRELAATDWGYGGQTQEARKAARAGHAVQGA